jgi:hypothetical protein
VLGGRWWVRIEQDPGVWIRWVWVRRTHYGSFDGRVGKSGWVCCWHIGWRVCEES